MENVVQCSIKPFLTQSSSFVHFTGFVDCKHGDGHNYLTEAVWILKVFIGADDNSGHCDLYDYFRQQCCKSIVYLRVNRWNQSFSNKNPSKKTFNSLFLLIHQECEEKYCSSFRFTMKFKKWWFSNGIFLNTFSKVQLIPIWHKKTRLDFRCSFGGCVALPCLRWLFSSPLEWESIKKCCTNSMANIHVKHFMLP